jgi:hypothetical protein
MHRITGTVARSFIGNRYALAGKSKRTATMIYATDGMVGPQRPTSTGLESFRRTELLFRVDMRSRALRIVVLDAATKATIRTIFLKGSQPPEVDRPSPLLVDRYV